MIDAIPGLRKYPKVGMVEAVQSTDFWTVESAVTMRTLKQHLLDCLFLIAVLAMGILVILCKDTFW